MSKYPSGLNIIEAMAPQLSRYAVATKTDYFYLREQMRRNEEWRESMLRRILEGRMRITDQANLLEL